MYKTASVLSLCLSLVDLSNGRRLSDRKVVYFLKDQYNPYASTSLFRLGIRPSLLQMEEEGWV